MWRLCIPERSIQKRRLCDRPWHRQTRAPDVPAKKDNETTFNENLYGYVCVPISTEWLPRKKYIYTLEFCGQESGAGIYPPEDDMTDLGLPTGGDGKEYITVIPTDPADQKKPEIQFLTNPIKFSVSVKDWDEAWKDGNEGNIPMK